MSRRDQDIREAILAALPGDLTAVPLSRIEARLQAEGVSASRRTLQRHLAVLEREGRVFREGRSVAITYRRADTASAAGDSGIILSEEGRAVLDLISRPAMARRPVTYNQAFLDDYEPNTTFYLPEPLRSQLHDMGRTGDSARPAGTHLRDVIGRLMIDLSWASSKLEGNTYSRLDTENLIRFGTAAEGKDLIEGQMILNHKAAIELIAEAPDEVGYDSYTFLNLHALLSENLLADPAACGRLRRRPVDIGGSVYTPLAIPQRIEANFRTILDKAGRIEDPFEASFFLMVHIPYLQPFEDVNKRVSRLGANIPLIRHNLSPLSFIDMPEEPYFQGTQAVYELNRTALLADVYLAAYERSCQRYAAIVKSLPEPDPLRLRYREQIRALVRDIVVDGHADIGEYVADITDPDTRARLQEIVDAEIANLHEGNVLRFGIRRSEFHAWVRRREA
ncbi:Fic family protein [Rhodobacteraceae bacterium 2376]|uniref:Fic family protein n=1 Tax=Rhabdonatronobacter sediminivivens TaxID=2743469 RepID=A0A7Z0KZZ2_9RHOB|nr:Fic family protein [Rhabdonatronobacter sediminivivens]NYS26899.1 Fic family protein [Rhabdonatronobacter sediminivivens]